VQGQKVDDVARQPWLMPDETQIPKELAAILGFETAPDGTVTFTLSATDGGLADAEADRPRQFFENLRDSPAGMRLIAFSMFHLHRTQGIWQ
jgi:hypothetical protein